MKIISVLFIILLTLNSCEPSIQEDAEALCKCYRSVSIYTTDTDKVENIVDSCEKIQVEILSKFEAGSEDHQKFYEYYDFCRDQ